MPAFADLVTYFLDELFALQPDIATAVGDHRYDDQWPDTSEAGRAGPARVRGSLAQGVRRPRPDRAVARRSDRSRPDPGRARCRRVRRGDPARGRLGPDVCGSTCVGSGLHPLLAREFAPLAQRLASVTGRLEGIPTIVADARATIGSVPERPVSRLHAEIAGKRIGGVADLGRQAVETAEAAAATGRGGRPGAAAVAGRVRRGGSGPGGARWIPGRRGGARRHGRRGAGRGAVRREAAPHDAGPGHHPRGDPRSC